MLAYQPPKATDLLTVKDILQINGTVIAGALILLTISNLELDQKELSNFQLFVCATGNNLIVGFIVIAFALSSLAALRATNHEIVANPQRFKSTWLLAKRMMYIGFAYLIAAMILLMMSVSVCYNS